MKNLIYVVDDEKDICDLVCSELALFGYEPKAIHSGADALKAIKQQPPKLCIVDLGLPDMDGLNLIKKLCDNPTIGVLILSGRGELTDKVLGLELGADDYIAKPFEIRELVARVNSVQRRLEKTAAEADEIRRYAKFADWTFNLDALALVSSEGTKHMLSHAEANLLTSLLRRPQQIVSRDQLLGDQIIPYDRSIDSRMSRLRKKIELDPKNPQIIKTIYGAGYMISTPVEWSTKHPI